MTDSRATDAARVAASVVRGSVGVLGVVLVVVGVGLTTGSIGAALLTAGILLVIDRVSESVGANR